MTLPGPTGTPQIERPIDLDDIPGGERPDPARTPEHHPGNDDPRRPDVPEPTRQG